MEFPLVCRTCLSSCSLEPIFYNNIDSVKYSDYIFDATGVRIQHKDNLPQNICKKCMIQLKNTIQFRTQCKNTETYLLQCNATVKIIKIKSIKKIENKSKATKIHDRNDSTLDVPGFIKLEHDYDTNKEHNRITQTDTRSENNINNNKTSNLKHTTVNAKHENIDEANSNNYSYIFALKNDKSIKLVHNRSDINTLVTAEETNYRKFIKIPFEGDPWSTVDSIRADDDDNMKLIHANDDNTQRIINNCESINRNAKEYVDNQKPKIEQIFCEEFQIKTERIDIDDNLNISSAIIEKHARKPKKTVNTFNGDHEGNFNDATQVCIENNEFHNSNEKNTDDININNEITDTTYINNDVSNKNNDNLDIPYIIQDLIIDKNTKVTCKICQAELSIRSIDYHMSKRHPGADGRKVKCDQCDAYVLREKLNRHQLMMHGRGRLECGFCLTRFENKDSLTQHVATCTHKKKKRKIHKAGKELAKCDECHKTMQRASIRMHKLIKHAGLKPVCAHCGISFGSKFRLKEHCRAKHGYEKLQCSYCEFQSASVMAMQNHERRHRGEKPFVCESCGAKFHAAYLLAQHKHSHRTEKTVKCDLCPATFKANNSLHMHKATCHSTALYKCSLCSRSYSSRYYAMKHVKHVHRYNGNSPPIEKLPKE